MRFGVFIVGLVSISLIFLGILSGSPLLIFVDPTTLIILGGLSVGFVMQSHGAAGLVAIGRAMKDWCSRDPSPPKNVAFAELAVETAAKGTIRAAYVCMLIGWVQMLRGADPHNLDVWGPALSVMFLSLFYAHCINFLLLGPLGRWLQQSKVGALSANG